MLTTVASRKAMLVPRMVATITHRPVPPDKRTVIAQACHHR
jgi:hypothetical protein